MITINRQWWVLRDFYTDIPVLNIAITHYENTLLHLDSIIVTTTIKNTEKC